MADPHAHDTAPGTAPGTDIDTGEYAALFPTLTFDRPADGVLRITLDGPGLNSLIIGRSKLLDGHSLALMTQPAEALQTVHDAGFVHRDLCPRNFV